MTQPHMLLSMLQLLPGLLALALPHARCPRAAVRLGEAGAPVPRVLSVGEALFDALPEGLA